MSTSLIKKHMTLPFLNKGTSENPEWVQIKKATTFAHSLNPDTEERDYIADEQPTTELKQYKPSLSLSVTTLAGEPDFELFYSLYKTKAIGEDAKKELLLVYLFDTSNVNGVDYYAAYKANATISVSEFNTVDSTISIEINENGTPTYGYVYLEDGAPVFTEGDLPEEDDTETEEESVAVSAKDAYGTYEMSAAIKAAIQDEYLSKMKSEYNLDYDGEMQSFNLTLAAGKKATAELKFACGYEDAHWPSDVTLTLGGTYTFVSGNGSGTISALAWDFDSLTHEAVFTGAHNESSAEHTADETEHTANEAATIKDEDAAVAKTLAEVIAAKYLAAPLTFANGVLTDADGTEIASK